ncbi:MAG TPA: microviridin/marinostatin family tricyclic proteinase inhibitor [Myxococcaceae bacterium]|nr:microviridin/marinostatin family tricyclic proteinase inhibitor [Myxococcaceae bacterium]
MNKEAEKKEAQKVPFFVRFLEKQEPTLKADQKSLVGTIKYPSDNDEA